MADWSSLMRSIRIDHRLGVNAFITPIRYDRVPVHVILGVRLWP
jgi:hypothetical protein